MQLRCEVDDVVRREILPIESCRLRGDRLGRRRFLARHIRLRHGLFDDGPHGRTGDAIEDVRVRLLRQLHDRFDAPAADGDVGENWRRSVVAIPDVMVHDLEVPDTLARARVEAHERR